MTLANPTWFAPMQFSTLCRRCRKKPCCSCLAAGIAKPTVSQRSPGACSTEVPLGWGRVQAICDFVHNHLKFGYEHARPTKTAWEAIKSAPVYAGTSPIWQSHCAAA